MTESIDNAKLKVLIKYILIQESPSGLTASQITSIINQYNWGFKSAITSSKIGKLLGYEISKHDTNFLKNIDSRKERGRNIYFITEMS